MVITVLYNESRAPIGVNITWAPLSGSFDLKQYHVRACDNTTCIDRPRIMTTSTEIEFSLSIGDTVSVNVTAESQCGAVGSPGMSNVTVVPLQENPSCKYNTKVPV